MSEAVSCHSYKNLPILLGTIRQETGEGELVLEQNDGVRRFHFRNGELIYLRSEAAGEQFGSYLLRQGILDLSSLNQLLADSVCDRLGEKVIKWGLMSLEERDSHLQSFQEQIMIHALEHPILHWTWNADSVECELSQDLHFKLQHRHFIWRTFQAFNNLLDLLTVLETETAWKWAGRRQLLDNLSDLPLTSHTAYAISFFTAEPISFETFQFLSNLDEDAAGRFIATLWTIGALVLSSAKLPAVTMALVPNPSEPVPRPLPLPLIMPPPSAPFGPPKQRVPEAPSDIDQLDINNQPEFIDLDLGTEGSLDLQPTTQRLRPDDMPPCGPRPQPRPEAASPPEDMPPCGLRPQPRPQLDISSQTSFIELDPERKGVPVPPIPQSLFAARKLLDRARRQVMLGRTVEAVYTLEQAVQLQPDGDAAYEAWLMLGRLRMVNPNWSTRAIHALQNAARIRTREVEPWTTMGEIYHRTGFDSNAVACFQKALELDSSIAIPPDIDLNGAPDCTPSAKLSKKGFFGGRGGNP